MKIPKVIKTGMMVINLKILSCIRSHKLILSAYNQGGIPSLNSSDCVLPPCRPTMKLLVHFRFSYLNAGVSSFISNKLYYSSNISNPFCWLFSWKFYTDLSYKFWYGSIQDDRWERIVSFSDYSIATDRPPFAGCFKFKESFLLVTFGSKEPPSFSDF